MAIDISQLPPVIIPSNIDLLDYTSRALISLLTLCEQRGLFTRQEYGDNLASGLDPVSPKPAEQLLAVLAHCMQVAKPLAEFQTQEGPILRLVKSDSDGTPPR